MTDYVLAGLTKRRAELAGEADTLRARLAQIGTDVGHLDAVIRQFDPDYDLGSIRSKRQRGPDAAQPGEMSRFVLGVLRNATEPMPTTDIRPGLWRKEAWTGRIASSLSESRSGSCQRFATKGRKARCGPSRDQGGCCFGRSHASRR